MLFDVVVLVVGVDVDVSRVIDIDRERGIGKRERGG